ncbi:MAG: MFS transporter, partial [Acidimicrobiales bacterium]
MVTVPPPPPRRARSALTREHARPAVLREWPHAWRLAVATVCIGAFMGQLDASAVTLTYRPVQAEFHASLAGVQWTSLAYLLVLVTMLVPAGRLSDRHGRKLMYLYGFV